MTEAQIPEVLKEAVIADEDRNFYHQGGVDLRGTLRALWDDVRGNGPLQGGSTITQQYVKLAYTNQQRTLVRKVREAILASQLDRQASKDEILYRYLTVVYFGDGNYGVGAAAESYFHVPVSALNASQAATLAGLIPAPSARAPRENPAGAEAARELVLREMHQQGYLTEAQYTAALAQRTWRCRRAGTARADSDLSLPVEPTAVPRFRRLCHQLAAGPLPGLGAGGGGAAGADHARPGGAERRVCSGALDPVRDDVPAGDGPRRGRAADRFRAGHRRRPGLRARPGR